MKKLCIFILFSFMIMIVLTGCSGKNKGDNIVNTNGKDATPIQSEETTDKDVTVSTDDKDNKNDAKQAEKKEPVPITIWHDKEEKVAAVLQAELDKLAPDIVVKLEKKDGLTDSLKLVGNDPKAAPDMYFFAHDKIGVYAEMGILAPITDFIPKESLENYIGVTINAATYKGEIYQLPLYYETLLFMYNKEFMNETEVPKTTESLYEYMKVKIEEERYGFVEQHSTAYYSVPWIHAFGGYILNDQGQPGLNLAETKKALSYHKKFVEFMPGESDYNTVNILFMEGMADSIIGGPWLVPAVRARGIDLGFAKMPVVDETGLPLAPYSGVQGLHVLKVAAQTKKEAITEIMTLLTNTDIGIAMANASGCAPANSLCYEDPSVKEDDMVMTMKETAETAIPMPNVPEMDVMWSATENMLITINMGGGDPEEEAEKAQKKAMELINSMK